MADLKKERREEDGEGQDARDDFSAAARAEIAALKAEIERLRKMVDEGAL